MTSRSTLSTLISFEFHINISATLLLYKHIKLCGFRSEINTPFPGRISAPSSVFCLFVCLFLFFYFMAVLGLRFCARAFSSCGKRGPLLIAVHRPLTIAASLVVEHRLQTRRLSNCGSLAQLLHGMWDPPRPGLEPVSPALAGRFSTTAPPGKPLLLF